MSVGIAALEVVDPLHRIAQDRKSSVILANPPEDRKHKIGSDPHHVLCLVDDHMPDVIQRGLPALEYQLRSADDRSFVSGENRVGGLELQPDPGRKRVKSCDIDPIARVGRLLSTVAQNINGRVREGNGQDLVGIGPIVNELTAALCDDLRLARAWARQHEKAGANRLGSHPGLFRI